MNYLKLKKPFNSIQYGYFSKNTVKSEIEWCIILNLPQLIGSIEKSKHNNLFEVLMEKTI